ncbi:MAG: hypothetical protein PHH82_00770 [Candidatus ainarchaeum sp.]|nr:hypothetical protein [Candidatus ainarchaeum sp.]
MTSKDINKRIGQMEKKLKNKSNIKKRVSKILTKHAPLFKSLSTK